MASQQIEQAFRPQYRELKDGEKARVQRIKALAAELAEQFSPFDNREKSLAMTKLEECVMWAVKGITG